MLVSDLILLLQNAPPGAEVFVPCPLLRTMVDVDGVDINEDENRVEIYGE